MWRKQPFILFPFLVLNLMVTSANAHWPGHDHDHNHSKRHAAKQPASKETEVIDKELYPELNDGSTYELQASGPVSVGLGQASLLPGFPMVMSYGSDEPTREFYDTAKVKSMAFRVDKQDFLILEYDVIGIQNEQTEWIKDTIAGQTSLKARHIIVAATHNHSYGRTHKPKVYKLMADQGLKATRRALKSQFPAKIGFGKKKIPEDLNLNRAELNGKANPLLYVIRVEDTSGHLRGLHYNYGSHPTVFTEWGSSRGKIGPNWPGYVNHYVQYRKRLDLLFERYSEKNGINTLPFIMFSEGSAGDQQPRSTDIFLDGERQPGNKVFMERLARQVIKLAEETETKRKMDLQFKAKAHTLSMKNGDQYMTLLQTLVMNETALATIPGELNVALGDKMEKHSPYEQNILLTNSDDYVGYIVREKIALESVTYQSKGVPFEPFYGEGMINAIITMLDSQYVPDSPANPEEVYGQIKGKVRYDGPHKIAIGAMRMPRTPNYGGGFFGQRTVVNTDGTFRIDSLSPGQFYLYVMETPADTPAPGNLKSGFSDIRPMTYGVPVKVRAQQTTEDVNFHFPKGYRKTSVKSLSLPEKSLEVKAYTVSGNLNVEGDYPTDREIEVRAFPAGVHYRELAAFMAKPFLTTSASKDGSFTLKGIPEGRYHLAAFLDVNNNDLVEKGIDKLTKPLDCPVIEIKKNQENNTIRR